jgi:hypothetical protein
MEGGPKGEHRREAHQTPATTVPAGLTPTVFAPHHPYGFTAEITRWLDQSI